ncbi:MULTISPECIES: hypothetical protein [Corallococcus]|uniref:hypothetical protein n=1 Tax=Corallococcus TaxID=83461 RepID=UPI0011C43CF2|nr:MULTISPECIES: hypothetical protein [Corallococcus]NPC68213.1 hypothetical protein [Corallococcus exiguus]NPD25248.1 hypothetical protein [Corallococcus exiguus]
MPDRTPTNAAKLALGEGDIERQLEGRAEVLAAACRSHAELEKVLASWRWRHALSRRPELVPALEAGAEALKEALERIHRRAELDVWPQDLPVLRTARELASRRTRLAELVRRRLEALGIMLEDPSLEEALMRLDAQVRQPSAWVLNPGEVLVFEADLHLRRQGRRAVPSKAAPGPFVFHQEPTLPAHLPPSRRSRGLPWPLPGSGQVRITSERLLWRSAFGESQGVGVDTLHAEGLLLDQSTGELRIGRDQRLHTRRVRETAEVVALVELLRWPPLRDALRSRTRSEAMALFPATLGAWRGFCALRHRGLAFISTGQGPQALGAITGGTSSLPAFDVDRLMEALRWLPEEAFEACLARIVAATGSRSWTRDALRFIPERSSRRSLRKWPLHIDCGGKVLIGSPDGAQEIVAEGILRYGPR